MQFKLFTIPANDDGGAKEEKNYTCAIVFLLFLFQLSCLSFAQERNMKLVKAPAENLTVEKRKAVVIGMSEYGGDKSLKNTINDAEDMADVFTRLGFEVTLLTNNDLRNLRTNLTAWYSTIEGNEMAVFYFAGHGMEVNGDNYLVPVAAELESQSDVEDYTLKVNNVLRNMDERQVGMKLIILDACRDNPFKRSWSRGSEVKGLAQMTAPVGAYIAFAAAPGFTAQDGGNFNLRNGVFTHFLKQEIIKGGLSIDEIFNNVSGGVSNLTNRQQTPFKNSSLTKNFYFKPPDYKPATAELPLTVEITKKYFYYIDQYDNESSNRFDDRRDAEREMRSKNLYGRIFSNAGEVFVVLEKPAEPVKTEPVSETVDSSFADYEETVNSLNIVMVAVQGGTFTMGCSSENNEECNSDEIPAHQVIVSDFFIGKYEVTQAQWKAVMDNNPSKFKGDNLPVESVSWKDVQEFIRKLNGLTGKQYRLPTEAEWEYAARGGNKSNGYKFSGSNTVDSVAWYHTNSRKTTHEVGMKLPDELGLYDMSGNVWEWCSDWSGAYRSDVLTNPQGPLKGARRVIRGGSWINFDRNVRVSYRGTGKPGIRDPFLGFRLACSSK